VQVDETDVVRVSLGDSVQVTIDAFPDTTFVGRVSKISNSAKLTAWMSSGQGGSNDRAVDFDVEITLAAPPRDVRPDLSCTARVVTDTRTNALAIPIIALTVREHEAVPNEGTSTKASEVAATPAAGPDSSKGGKPKKEREGVFVVRDGKATFRPVKVGIAGDEYFEVLDGLRPDEVIVAGTYQAIRDLKDGAKVKEAKAPDTKKDAKRS
jgi:HlyD family secretion protein